MTAIEVARKVTEARQAHLVRFRMENGNHEPPYQYDAKSYRDGGSKKGWILLDLFSASAIVSVYDSLTPANQERFARLDLFKMAKIAFRLLDVNRWPHHYYRG